MSDIDYNDGKWHNHIGADVCPIHVQSIVNVIHVADGSPRELESIRAGYQLWENVAAFRVTKPYVEPKVAREFWIYTNRMHAYLDDMGGDFIHVREVLPDDSTT